MSCSPVADTGFLCNLRRIFTGGPRRKDASPCKGKVYTYTPSQLRCIEQELCCLEDEARCLECAIKEAFCCACSADCEYLRCSLKNVCDKLSCIIRDLESAQECYDPCRDRCESELICCLMDRARCLDYLISDLSLQVDCLECEGGCCPDLCCNRRVADCRQPCDPCKPRVCDPCTPCGYNPCGPRSCGPCRPRACSPCGPCGPTRPSRPCGPCCRPCSPRPCPRPVCGVRCRKPSCPPACNPGCTDVCCVKPSICRTNSVIPMGVMLVKL